MISTVAITIMLLVLGIKTNAGTAYWIGYIVTNLIFIFEYAFRYAMFEKITSRLSKLNDSIVKLEKEDKKDE